jgi:hypothetical protein
MNDKKIPIAELILLSVGEAAVSALTVTFYFILGKFNYTVVMGVILGSAVIIFNFIFLSLAVNSAIDSLLAERGQLVMDEAQAAAFAAEHRGRLNKTIQLSHTVRTLSIVGVLAAAFIIGHFDVVATVIPIIAFRPLIVLGGLVKKKEG